MGNTTKTLKMNAIGIVASDMKRSLEFYAILGVPVPEFDASEDHFQCQLDGGLSLMWDTVDLVKNFLPNYEHGKGSSLGLCFECSSPAEVDEIHGRLMAAGFESLAAPWDAFWGQRYSIVRDPDFNAISLYAPLAS